MSQASLAQRTRTLVRATESKTALDQLIRVARKERKVDPTVWQYPNFLTRLFTSPCAKIGNCCLDHKEWYEDPVGSVLILAPIFLFIAALVTGGALDHQVDSTLLGFWDIFRWVLGSVVSIVGFSTLPIISKRQLERWEQHKSDLANKRQELERLKPEEFLVPYLQTELAKVREAVLGEQAPLRTFGDALRLRHERLLALDKELMAQINLAPSMAFALRSDQKANQEAIAKLEQKETRVQDLIARTTAYYNLIDERINGISPLLQARRLHERAVAEIGA
ncbi:MAG TPA: hypothetical protein VFQ60_00465, partial [Patescibacteria group bacterium]|nr:hypothetical protein [Patescibacteria group bacterium]